MKNLFVLARQLDVAAIALELRRHPDVWDAHKNRATGRETPHAGASDVWVRYAPTWDEGRGPHDSVWYPPIDVCPSLRPVIFGVMAMVQAERLGGVLITKIPPGGSVKPHTDAGWHAEYYDKIAVQIESHQQQAFCYEDGAAVTAPGDVYWFNNQAMHWVVNDSPVDRVTLIICVKLSQPLRVQLKGD